MLTLILGERRTAFKSLSSQEARPSAGPPLRLRRSRASRPSFPKARSGEKMWALLCWRSLDVGLFAGRS
jgi:hypothetical protein